MAHFYGELQGGRGETTRIGTARSGLRTLAASWAGAVSVRLWVNNGVDWATVALTTHHGSGSNRVLYSGPVSGAPVEKLHETVRNHVAERDASLGGT